ncbi:fimbrillin family protein [Culturomica massiliensis]|uniref:fimbrillin family protein n=1 Tax=Culturomica massiliensis TaxID=1841857 RepID=UPI002666BED2|nr:fimbrillin family protein [Culturomica massiliensis]
MKRAIYTLCLFLVIFSCKENGLKEQEIKKAATFFVAPGTSTRATDTSFEPYDEIGIFAVERLSSDIPGLLNTASYAINRRYRIDHNGNLLPVSKEDEIYLSRIDYYDIYAYYPYTEKNYDPQAIDFKLDYQQNSMVKYKQHDVLFAKALGIWGNSSSIGLNFSRKMAAVDFQLRKEQGIKIRSVVLSSAYCNCRGNLATGTVEATGEKYTISMYPLQETTNAYTFRALLPEQILPASTQLYMTANSSDHSLPFQTVTDVPLSSGKTSMFPADMMYRVYVKQRGEGRVSGAGIYKHGEIVTIMAIPAPGYGFEGWYYTDDGIWSEELPKVSTELKYSFPVTKYSRFIANFIPKEI